MAASRWWRWLFQIRTRLLLLNALIVGVPLAGISFARFYEREMLRGLEDDMIHQAQLLRAVLSADPLGPRLSERGPMLAAAARDTRTRIRLLDASGALQADSHAQGPPEGPEPPPPSFLPQSLPARSAPEARNFSVQERAEIRRALRGEYGAATRLWEHQEIVYLFSALPLLGPQKEVRGVIYVTRSTLPVQRAMYRLRGTLFTILGIALASTMGITLFFAATISRPLSALTARAQKIAAGARDVGLSSSRRDEIGDLARAFDKMAQQLDARVQQTRQLAADVSHEFKSPLTSLRGAAELLLDGAADDPEARARFLQNILEDTKRLDRLVSRLLELSRAEADASPAELFDLEALLRECARRSQGAPVELRYTAKRTQFVGRRALLSSAIGNLLDNAQVFARPGSTITLTAHTLPEQLVLAVHNWGEPIKPANLDKIWQRFFTTRAPSGGTGLGLAIVAAAAHAHGGQTTVESSAEAGTRFSLTLPLG